MRRRRRLCGLLGDRGVHDTRVGSDFGAESEWNVHNLLGIQVSRVPVFFAAIVRRGWKLQHLLIVVRGRGRHHRRERVGSFRRRLRRNRWSSSPPPPPPSSSSSSSSCGVCGTTVRVACDACDEEFTNKWNSIFLFLSLSLSLSLCLPLCFYPSVCQIVCDKLV